MSFTANQRVAPPKFVSQLPLGTNCPEGKTLGPVVGLAIGPDDGHIWVLHQARERRYGPDNGEGNRLPPVVEFDAEGNFLRAWGGPDHLPAMDDNPQWPRMEETIALDDEGSLWVFGSDKEYDHAALRFNRDGELLLRIGEYGVCGNDESHHLLGCPTDAWHDVANREVFITDGYVNHRVAVFDSDTGAFKRAWGAYAAVPPFSGEGTKCFNNPVHAISRGPEGYLYVCDRMNNRIQVFDAVGKTGVRFVRELEIDVPSAFGTTFNVAFDPSERFMFVCDGNNGRLWIVSLETWETVDTLLGPPPPETADMMETIHKIVIDRQGNLLLARCARGVEKLARAD